MYDIGCDLHKKNAYFVTRNSRGKIVSQQNVVITSPFDVINYLKHQPSPRRLTVEASCNWFWFVDAVEDYVDQLALVDPGKAKEIARAHIKAKTDKIDGNMLAMLTQRKLIAPLYIPPKEIRDQRELLRYRTAMVRIRTRLKNMTHALLLKNGLTIKVSDLFGIKGRALLRMAPLRPSYHLILEQNLQLIDAISEQIAKLEEEIYSQPFKRNKSFELVKELPGFGDLFALHLNYEMGSIGRFPGPKSFVLYCGLAPRTNQSAEHLHHGKLIPQSNRWLKWILVEAAQHARYHPVFSDLYQRMRMKHGKQVAKIAVARKLAIIIYHMLSKQEHFRGQVKGCSTPKVANSADSWSPRPSV